MRYKQIYGHSYAHECSFRCSVKKKKKYCANLRNVYTTLAFFRLFYNIMQILLSYAPLNSAYRVTVYFPCLKRKNKFFKLHKPTQRSFFSVSSKYYESQSSSLLSRRQVSLFTFIFLYFFFLRYSFYMLLTVKKRARFTRLIVK